MKRRRTPVKAAVAHAARRLAAVALFIVSPCGGCSRPDLAPLEIQFVARIGGAPFACERPLDGSAAVRPVDLRLYVSDVQLLDEAARATPMSLVPDGVFQDARVALLDFETGTGTCRNGTNGTHTTIVGRAPAGRYHGLRFTVGVPFALNHADPTAAEPPLTLGAMHWGWQAGYKFLRFEAADDRGAAYRLHLGSTGCAGTIGHIEHCTHPNRAIVSLSDFTPGRSRVVIQLAALLASSPSPAWSCQSGEDEPSCDAAFAALGIDRVSGQSTGRQWLFEVSGS